MSSCRSSLGLLRGDAEVCETEERREEILQPPRERANRARAARAQGPYSG